MNSLIFDIVSYTNDHLDSALHTTVTLYDSDRNPLGSHYSPLQVALDLMNGVTQFELMIEPGASTEIVDCKDLTYLTFKTR